MQIGAKLLAGMLLLVGLTAATAAKAADRVAFVVGNSDYQHAVALPNPTNDAGDISLLLKSLNFEVIEGNDLDRREMEEAIRRFAQASASAKVVLFFYAGHGMQVSGRNYLIPVDAKLEDRTALDFEAIDVEKVFQYMTGEGKIALAFLDACRNNPLARNFARSLGATRSVDVGNGLAPSSTTGSGMFIAYATAPDDVALDGEGRNSPFTTALLRNLPTPNLEIQQVMTRVKAEVQQETGGRQRPWHNSDLGTEVFLASAPADGPKPPPAETDPSTVLWNAISDTDDRTTFELFLNRFPESRHAAAARLRIAALTEDQPVDRPSPPEGAALAARQECKHLGQVLQYIIDPSITGDIHPRDIVSACERATVLSPGDGEVEFLLAEAYANFYGWDDVRTLRAYKKASDAGYEKGTYYYASYTAIPQNGTSDRYDPVEAEQLLMALSPEQDYMAATTLANIYQYAGPEIKDLQKAIVWKRLSAELAQKAADAGDTYAAYIVATDYRYGVTIGETPVIAADPLRAVPFFRMSAEAGNINSWWALLEIAIANPTMFTEIEREEFRSSLLASAEALLRRGHLGSGWQLGFYYQYTEKDLPRAIAAFSSAAERGSLMAMDSLAGIYQGDEAKNPAEARRWIEARIAHSARCPYLDEEVLDYVNPSIRQIATPEAAARCYLRSLVGSEWGEHYEKPEMMSFAFRNISPTGRRALQSVLKQAGYYSGAIDGQFGSGTAAAFKRFTYDNPEVAARALGGE